MNHLLRQVPPSLIEDTAQRHDNFAMDTLRQPLGTTELDEKTQAQAKLPLRLAGLGLRDSTRTSVAAFWSSWADSFTFLCERFPDFENNFGIPLCNDPRDGTTLRHNPTLLAVQTPRRLLLQTGLRLAIWNELRHGAEAGHYYQALPNETYPGEGRAGWQAYTTRAPEEESFEHLKQNSTRTDLCRYRSASGNNSSRWLTAVPTSNEL